MGQGTEHNGMPLPLKLVFFGLEFHLFPFLLPSSQKWQESEGAAGNCKSPWRSKEAQTTCVAGHSSSFSS